MKAIELLDLSPTELQTRLDDMKEELFKLRFQQASGQLEDNNRIRIVKRNIARVMTVMTGREKDSQDAE